MKSMILILALTASTVSFAATNSPEACQLKVAGMTTSAGTFTDANGQGFYSAVAQMSQQNHTCYYAKIDQVPNSGRVYNDGQLMTTRSGQKKGLSNSEAREAMANSGSYCTTVSCIPLQYNAKPQYEQPVQVPSYPSSQSAE